MNIVASGLNFLGWAMVAWPWLFVVWHWLRGRNTDAVIWLIGAVVSAAAVLWSRAAFSLMGFE